MNVSSAGPAGARVRRNVVIGMAALGLTVGLLGIASLLPEAAWNAGLTPTGPWHGPGGPQHGVPLAPAAVTASPSADRAALIRPDPSPEAQQRIDAESGRGPSTGSIDPGRSRPVRPSLPKVTSVVHDGATSDRAAASCWEIKQRTGTGRNGFYWLQTARMTAPERHRCDMVTAGGGWLLIGQGREGWSTRYSGQNSQGVAAKDIPTGKAAQLSGRRVNELLSGRAGRALSKDGLLLRRALDERSTQTVRFTVTDMRRFSWALNAATPVATAAADGKQIGNGTTARFGTATEDGSRVVNTREQKHAAYVWGFGFGNVATTDSSPGARIFTAPGAAPIPEARLYLRPRLTQASEGFTPVPAEGTPASPGTRTQVVASGAAAAAWTVTGRVTGGKNENHTPVQAFAQVGPSMFVGGNFAQVVKGEDTDSARAQPFLAAFDADSRAWRTRFRPRLDGQVKALVALPGHRLGVGGDFLTVNGDPSPGLAVLDARTGELDPDWKLRLQNRVGAAPVSVRSLSLSGRELYIGGAFTHLQRDGEPVYARNAARVDPRSGRPDPDWTPEFAGTVTDLNREPGSAWVFAAGYFRADLRPGQGKADALAKISAGAGARIQEWDWERSAPERDYQWAWAAVQTHGNVFVGANEHLLRTYDADTLEMKQANITKPGGDFQAAVPVGDVVYAACHCDGTNYSGAVNWKLTDGFDQADAIDMVGAWDAESGALQPAFQPKFKGERSQGVWALAPDARGRLWVGGDLTHAADTDGKLVFTGGFAVFDPVPATPPDPPKGQRAQRHWGHDVASTEDRLRWDPVPGVAGYEILRNDRVVTTVTARSVHSTRPDRRALTVSLPATAGARYAVRAVDEHGNRSASGPLRAPLGSAA